MKPGGRFEALLKKKTFVNQIIAIIFDEAAKIQRAGVRDVIFLLTATQPSAGSGKEIPEGGGERVRGEVAGFRNSESGALS